MCYFSVCVCVFGYAQAAAAHALMQSFPKISQSGGLSVVYGYVTTITREKRGRTKVSMRD